LTEATTHVTSGAHRRPSTARRGDADLDDPILNP